MLGQRKCSNMRVRFLSTASTLATNFLTLPICFIFWSLLENHLTLTPRYGLQINTPDYSLNRPQEWGTCCDILVSQNQRSSLGPYKGKELVLTSKGQVQVCTFIQTDIIQNHTITMGYKVDFLFKPFLALFQIVRNVRLFSF